MGQSKEIFEVVRQKIRLTGIIAGISSVLYLYLKRFNLFFASQYGDYVQTVIISILWGIAAYSLILFILGLTKRFLFRKSSLLNYLSKSSFSLYIFHYFIIALINFFLLRTNFNHYIIWALTTLGTYMIFVVLFEVILKRIGFFRFICGIPRR